MCELEHSSHHVADTLLQDVLERPLRLLLGHIEIEPKDHAVQELRLAVLDACIHHHLQERDEERRVPSQDVVRLERVAQEQSVVLAVLTSHSLSCIEPSRPTSIMSVVIRMVASFTFGSIPKMYPKSIWKRCPSFYA